MDLSSSNISRIVYILKLAEEFREKGIDKQRDIIRPRPTREVWNIGKLYKIKEY